MVLGAGRRMLTDDVRSRLVTATEARADAYGPYPACVDQDPDQSRSGVRTTPATCNEAGQGHPRTAVHGDSAPISEAAGPPAFYLARGIVADRG